MGTVERSHRVARRTVLRWTAAGAAAALTTGAGLLGCRRDRTATAPPTDDVGSAAVPPSAGDDPVLGEPEVLSSRDGRLDVHLNAAVGPVELAGRSADTAAYNRATPGPTLHARPGDRVRLDLVNDLDESTNLHFHGLHVPPDGTADNVFVSVEPGARRRYSFVIPDDHPGGTFWYHPHRHGLGRDRCMPGCMASS